MAEVDIAPELYSEIEKRFKRSVREDATIKSVTEKVKRNRATGKDITAAAERLGTHASDALRAVLTPDRLPDGVMYWNIGDKTIRPLMQSVYDTVNTLAVSQKRSVDIIRNIAIGISLGTDPTDRIDTIIGFATNSKTPEELDNALDIPVKTTALDFKDDFDKRNAEIRNGVGFEQYVVREYDGVGLQSGTVPCEWCLDRAGTWSYQDAIDHGVFERHDGCGCTIEVVTEDDLGDVEYDGSIPF